MQAKARDHLLPPKAASKTIKPAEVATNASTRLKSTNAIKALAIDLAGAGLSFSSIAKRIHDDLGAVLTRNAVAGILFRAGVRINKNSMSGEVVKPVEIGGAKPVRAKPVRAKPVGAKPVGDDPIKVEDEPIKLAKPVSLTAQAKPEQKAEPPLAKEQRARYIFELKDSDCRWPSDAKDERGVRYHGFRCASPALPGSSWCAEHSAIVYSAPRETRNNPVAFSFKARKLA